MKQRYKGFDITEDMIAEMREWLGQLATKKIPMTNKIDGRKNNGGNRNAGRKSRQSMGLPPVKNTTVQVEQTVIDNCRELHGSLAEALRYAAMHSGRATQGAHIF